MTLPTIIEYHVLSNEDLRQIYVKYGSNLDISGIKEDIAQSIQKYTGQAVVIEPDERIPLWYYFALFYELYKHNPEIILRIDADTNLLLHTIYNNDHARSASVINQPLLRSIPEMDAAFIPKLQLNLSDVSVLSAATLKDDQITLPKDHIHTLILTGEHNHVSDLLTFRLWFSYAEQIYYQDNDQLISIVE